MRDSPVGICRELTLRVFLECPSAVFFFMRLFKITPKGLGDGRRDTRVEFPANFAYNIVATEQEVDSPTQERGNGQGGKDQCMASATGCRAMLAALPHLKAIGHERNFIRLFGGFDRPSGILIQSAVAGV